MKKLGMYVTSLAVLLLATAAGASDIIAPFLDFSATGSVTLSFFDLTIEGSGTGTLNAAAGALPAGTAVVWYLYGDADPLPATSVAGSVFQPFVPGGVEFYVFLPPENSNVLSAGSFALAGAGAVGVLGATPVTIAISVGFLSSAYIAGLPATALLSLDGMANAPLSWNTGCTNNCPVLNDFSVDLNISVAPPPSTVPEPSSLLLLGGGVLSAALRRWSVARNR